MTYAERAARIYTSHALFQLWKKGWNAREAGKPIVANVARGDAGRIAWERGWNDCNGRLKRLSEKKEGE